MRQGQIIKKFKSKKGKSIILRAMKSSDLKELHSLINSIIAEKDFTTQDKEISMREEKKWLKNALEQVKRNEIIYIVADYNGKIVGNSSIKKRSGVSGHVAEFGINVLNGFRSEGIGFQMMIECLAVAKKIFKSKMVVLDGGVFQTNIRAQNLYGKMGFKKYGELPKSIKRRGRYISGILMYKEL